MHVMEKCAASVREYAHYHVTPRQQDREGRWEGPLCGEEEVFHYGCRLHYIRQAVHMQKPHSRIIGWLILGTSCAADPDPSNMYHFLEPRSVLDPDPT